MKPYTTIRFKKLLMLTLFCVAAPSSLSAKIILMLEGVSGAGKSTLIEIISACMPEACTIPEPFDRWNNVHGVNLFELFLKDKSRWGLTFQSYIVITHYQALSDACAQNPATQLFITDRSHYSGFFVFARMLFDKKIITPMEWALFEESTLWLTEQLPYKPDGFIYLRTHPEIACARANERNRILNGSLNISYYETLHRYHEQWLVEKKHMPKSLQRVPVLILDGDVDFKNNGEAQRVIIQQIKNFIQLICNLDYTKP